MPPSRDFGSIHVQSDDEAAVVDAVRKYVPRFGRSAGSAVSRPRNGWIAVYDDLVDRDRAARRRLSQELSIALGAPVFTISLEEGAVVRYLLVSAAAWSTSTSRCRSTSARCRPATWSRSARTRPRSRA